MYGFDYLLNSKSFSVNSLISPELKNELLVLHCLLYDDEKRRIVLFVVSLIIKCQQSIKMFSVILDMFFMLMYVKVNFLISLVLISYLVL